MTCVNIQNIFATFTLFYYVRPTSYDMQERKGQRFQPSDYYNSLTKTSHDERRFVHSFFCSALNLGSNLVRGPSHSKQKTYLLKIYFWLKAYRIGSGG